MKSFNNQFSKYNKTVEKKKTQYSALLGMSETVIEHPTRMGFCYARMADNLSELIVVFNDKVSQAYNLPVLIERRGTVWYVVGRDAARYSNWGTSVPFLPKHAEQHEFNREAGTGADAVFIYPDQFMPLLCYPSGTSGSGNILVAPYILQTTNDFLYVGNTGTRNVLPYKPTDGNAIMGLVYLDKTTGNPDVLIASGTPFSNSITGTSQIAQYIPYPSANQEPLYAFRLVSGTSAILWENLYNVRQFIGGGFSTGSSGGGGSTGTSVPLFITGSVPFSGADGILTENNPDFYWNNTAEQLWIGEHAPAVLQNSVIHLALVSKAQNQGVGMSTLAYGTGTSGSPAALFNGYRSRGTLTTPLPVQNGDALVSIIGTGYDGLNWQQSARLRAYADGNYVTGTSTPSRWDFDVTPSGTTSRSTKMSVRGNDFDVHNSPAFSKEIFPSLTADQNNYAPSGIEDTFIINIAGSGGNWTIHGLISGRAGRLIVIRNNATLRFTLKQSSASASAGNKFKLPLARDVVLDNGEGIILRYNGTAEVWEATSNNVLGANPPTVAGNLISFADTTGKILYDIGTPNKVVAGAIITGTHKAVPADTDKFGYADSTGTTLFNTDWSEIKTIFNGAYQPTGSSASVSTDGWNDVGLTVNYFSADAPSFVINVQGNVTGTYAPATRWKLGHLGTTKYLIQTGLPTYVSGAYTAINLYGGTDYTLTTGTISNPQFSRIKAPLGFPMNTDKWTVLATDVTGNLSTGTPIAGTWYNLGLSLSVPIGYWQLEAIGDLILTITAAAVGSAAVQATLSTGTTTSMDNRLFSRFGIPYPVVVGGTIDNTVNPKRDILITAKTLYNLLARTGASVGTNLAWNGAQVTTLIRAECLYL